MKKILFGILIFSFILLFGCVAHNGERPFDYEAAKWISENPEGYFIVTSYLEDKDYIHPKGKILLDGVEFEFIMIFDHSDNVSIRKYNANYENGWSSEDPYVFCKCNFGSDKLVLKVSKDDSNLINENIEEIVFIKEIK